LFSSPITTKYLTEWKAGLLSLSLSKEIAALRRQRAHEEFEAGGGSEAVLKIGRRHGDLVKVREQGRMAKDFGHEGASGEIIENIGRGNNAAIRPCLPRKRFLTIVAEEVVVAHTDLPIIV
jgi:hypothetical protein